VEKAVLSGEAATMADGVAVDPNYPQSAVSVAATGLMAYRTGGGSQRQLTWMGRSGTARGTVGNPDDSLSSPSVSPDGRWVAVYRTVQGNADIWLLDAVRTMRLTFAPALDRFPIWSADGQWVVFDSLRKGHRDLYRKSSSGAGEEQLLVESSEDKVATDWSASGRFMLYQSLTSRGDWDIWALPMDGDRKPWPFLKTSFIERFARFSPDGHWVAYMSNESGRMEVYVRPFSEPGAAAAQTGGQWQVSAAGGIYPAWRPDGKELYYLNPAGAMMAAPIAVTGTTLARAHRCSCFKHTSTAADWISRSAGSMVSPPMAVS
jgi:Tol biopolymer transport system component